MYETPNPPKILGYFFKTKGIHFHPLLVGSASDQFCSKKQPVSLNEKRLFFAVKRSVLLKEALLFSLNKVVIFGCEALHSVLLKGVLVQSFVVVCCLFFLQRR